MDQFYKGAYFRIENFIYRYAGHVGDQVYTLALDLSKPGARWTKKSIPTDMLHDMSVFSWPKLGYRELKFGGEGSLTKGVWYYTSVRSAMRGLQSKLVNINSTPIMELFPGYEDPKNWLDPEKYMEPVFAPSFTPFAQGMQELKEGEAVAFALSEDFAVSISTTQSPSTLYDVLFRGDIVGEVMSLRNEVVLPRRLSNKTSIHNLFEGFVRP
jgi:hypothetical protein